MTVVSNRSSRRHRLLLIIFVLSFSLALISRRPIPGQVQRRMLPPRRPPQASTRGLPPPHAPRFRASPIPRPKHAPTLGERFGRSRSLLFAIGRSPTSEFAFVYLAFLACRATVIAAIHHPLPLARSRLTQEHSGPECGRQYPPEHDAYYGTCFPPNHTSKP